MTPHVLSNGRYAVRLSDAGTGGSTWDGFALTTDDGLVVYLRDAERGTVWSVGRRPCDGARVGTTWSRKTRT